MNNSGNWMVASGLAVVLTLIGVAFAWFASGKKRHRDDPASPFVADMRASESPVVQKTPYAAGSDAHLLREDPPPSLDRQEPVGWVFGRMVGFPGADRPLTGQPGSFGGAPPPPLPLNR